ncbi:hypothetical protein EMCRGX_G024628 [Ephydatia muelleri]
MQKAKNLGVRQISGTWGVTDEELSIQSRKCVGWSTKATITRRTSIEGESKATRISRDEISAIKQVVLKADDLEREERTRVGLLKKKCDERLPSGDGMSSCLICAKSLDSRARRSGHTAVCVLCEKSCCQSCVKRYIRLCGDAITLCPICFSEMDLWGKSGAWFTGALPLSVGNR